MPVSPPLPFGSQRGGDLGNDKPGRFLARIFKPLFRNCNQKRQGAIAAIAMWRHRRKRMNGNLCMWQIFAHPHVLFPIEEGAG